MRVGWVGGWTWGEGGGGVHTELYTVTTEMILPKMGIDVYNFIVL